MRTDRQKSIKEMNSQKYNYSIYCNTYLFSNLVSTYNNVCFNLSAYIGT